MKLRADHPWQLVLGLSVWALWFIAVYGGLSVGCAVAPPDASLGPRTPLNAALLLLTAATTGWLAFWAWQCLRATTQLRDGAGDAGANARRRFMAGVAAALHACAAVSTLVVGLPLLVVAPCV